MEQALKNLRAERAQVKSALTRFNTFMDKFVDDKIIQLESRLDDSKLILDNFSKIQNQIEILDEDEAVNTEREEFENRFYDSIERASIIIKRVNTAKKVANTINTSQNQELSNTSPQSISNVRFPALELPKFYGDYEKWGQFRDMFSTLVHNDVNMDKIKKFYYLLSCLKGDAQKVIECIEVTETNYDTAWDLMKSRYENNAIIITNHVRALFELPTIAKDVRTNLRKLTDDIQKHYRSLKTLGEPVDTWDTLLIYLISRKLDAASQKDWEEHLINKKTTSPKFNDLTTFLNNRCQLLETLNNNSKTESINKIEKFQKTCIKKYPNDRAHSHVSTHGSNSSYSVFCPFCKEGHYIYQCEKLKALSVASRFAEIKKLKLCTNCMRKNHTTIECLARGCKICSKKHNTLLHINNVSGDAPLEVNEVITQSELASTSMTVSVPRKSVSTHCLERDQQILLSTAVISIKGKNGTWHRCRAILDSGSQPNFIKSALCHTLGFTGTKTNIPIVGVGNSHTKCFNKIRTEIKSLHEEFLAEITFLILEKITENLPSFSFDISKVSIPPGLSLADANFNISSEIDALIGAEIFYDLLLADRIKLGDSLPNLQRTLFGWIITGPIRAELLPKGNMICNLSTSTINDQIQKFWTIEECSGTNNYSEEEQQCENKFIDTFKRDITGHFVVELPFRENIGDFGQSLYQATNRLYSIERKFMKNPEFHRLYVDFMPEYLSLGHMTKIGARDLELTAPKNLFYLPHHGVMNETSSTTKLRVVFDGSCKTSTGISLNDKLMVGPTIQDDLFSVLIRFRKHNYVINADIAKMYRMVNVAENQRDFQRIVWRTTPNEPISHYRLNTVTYGTSSASYLSIRCLHQVAIETRTEYPEISEIILRDFYVDDLLTGTNTIEGAQAIKEHLNKILEEYGFHLRKWVSNDIRILEKTQFDNEDNYFITNEESKKTLGLWWQAKLDIFRFKANSVEMPESITKRSILSTICKIFDPLGIVAPITIRAKLLLQKLWELNIGWDENLPANISQMWLEFSKQLPSIDNITIPRQAVALNVKRLEMHGFSDSSQSAYGACIFLKSITSDGEVTTRLLTAKSRVAPVKTIQLPRLELCGAVLLVNLYKKVAKAFNQEFDSVHFWTDSTIVLCWLSSPPNTWKIFVANRVSEIQSQTDINQWGHVPSEENPADIISRGIEPTKLEGCSLWWRGPKWLSSNTSYIPSWNIHNQKNDINPPEKRKIKLSFLIVNESFYMFNKFSSLYRLQRVVALIFRFYKNCRTELKYRKKGNISGEEINNAMVVLFRIAQQEMFPEEILAFKKKKSLPRKSKLASLNPFLDSDNIIRVGGRLKKSDLPFDKKFPIVLSQKHTLTKLIILNEHYGNLHAGPQAILTSLRQRYWPINGRMSVRSLIRKCLVCFRANPTSMTRIMGDLPTNRITQNRPFFITGIDFAGPFNIKDGKLRNRRIIKAYLCIFICFTTKAVHLEAVGDLSSAAFLNALKRFVSRRGLCKVIYSDNGTNFVGAHNEIKRVYESLSQFIVERKTSDFLLVNNIQWNFIPPRSPHHGGMWEAAVKMAKYHVTRVVGNCNLTFEELSTIFAQVEAIMNSRPLTPLSNDPNDLTVLTPGHFLIGDLLTSPPQTDIHELPSNRLSQYERLQQITQHFWHRWSREYLSHIQQRSKWKKSSMDSLKVGSMVILIDDCSPPQQWRLGRILELHPGSDGVVRVVSVKTSTAVTKRAVQKLCLLPIE